MLLIIAFIFAFAITLALSLCKSCAISSRYNEELEKSWGIRMFKRGMYLSLYATKVGQYQLPANLANILTNLSDQQQALNYIVKNKIDSISLYDLNTILSLNMSAQLSRFIQAARVFGVKQIYAVGGSSQNFDNFMVYHNSHEGKFDGLLTEIEFWTPGNMSFAEYITTLKYMRQIAPGLTIATYVGWLNKTPGLTQAQVADQITANADQVFVHCYVKNPTQAWAYSAERIQSLKASKGDIQIYPIFSAEGVQCNTGEEICMGDWLTANSLQGAENIFGTQSGNVQNGFQYFEQSFLRYYVK